LSEGNTHPYSIMTTQTIGVGSPLYETNHQTVLYIAASQSLGYLNVYDYGDSEYKDLLISGENSTANVGIGEIYSGYKLGVSGSLRVTKNFIGEGYGSIAN